MSMTLSDGVAAASFALSIVAIGLSLVLYRWSSEKSATIDRAVQRLDDIVGKLYADLFGEYRTTMSDLRKEFFSRNAVASAEDPETEARADAKLAELEARLETKLSDLLKQQTDTSETVSTAMHLVREALSKSRRVDEQAREEGLSDVIASAVQRLRRKGNSVVTIGNVIDEVYRGGYRRRVSSHDWGEAMRHLLAVGQVSMDPFTANPADPRSRLLLSPKRPARPGKTARAVSNPPEEQNP